MLGVELFGRSPTYDTGDDAIVRVTACDVRKRLNQFYVEFGAQSDFRIELPPGSYIPEIHAVAPPFLGDLWQVTVAQLAPIIPYLLLVLMLVLRPTGLMGTRES